MVKYTLLLEHHTSTLKRSQNRARKTAQPTKQLWGSAPCHKQQVLVHCSIYTGQKTSERWYYKVSPSISSTWLKHRPASNLPLISHPFQIWSGWAQEREKQRNTSNQDIKFTKGVTYGFQKKMSMLASQVMFKAACSKWCTTWPKPTYSGHLYKWTKHFPSYRFVDVHFHHTASL